MTLIWARQSSAEGFPDLPGLSMNWFIKNNMLNMCNQAQAFLLVLFGLDLVKQILY